MTQTTISAANGAAARAAPLVVVGAQNGLTLIPSPTALTRLNYFDGKFLRADDLKREQDYLRRLVELSNRAGGSGVVHGFDVLREGAGLRLSAGLAIDARGRVLYLPNEAAVDVRQLLERSRPSAVGRTPGPAGSPGFEACEVAAAPDATPVTAAAPDLYLLSIAHAEALCGEEDVYGRLCEEACVTTTDRPYLLEGVVVRATPLVLPDPACTAVFLSRKHRRSQAASAYFADERDRLGRPMSGQRLTLDVWCRGASAETGAWLPLAVLAMEGDAVDFVDAWIARRERIEAPPRRYWHWQTMMRPEAVFLAQVLQFQCHLIDALSGAPTPGEGSDSCAPQTRMLQEARRVLQQIGGEACDEATLSALAALRSRVETLLGSEEAPSADRILIDAGIVELPPAGYLPVSPGVVDVATQVRRLLGEGVDLRVCAVRPDFVAHALEEAQHLDRICLLQGLEDPARREEVDVLVPEGEIVRTPGAVGGLPLEVQVRLDLPEFDTDRPDDLAGTILTLRGAGRAEPLDSGGGAFHFAGTGEIIEPPSRDAAGGVATGGRPVPEAILPGDAFTRPTRGGLGARPIASRVRLPSGTGGVRPLSLSTLARAMGGGTTEPASRREPRSRAESDRDGTAAPRAQEGLPPSVWVSARVERNPFSLRPGQSTPVRAEIGLSVEDDGEDRAIEVSIQGHLDCNLGGGGQPGLSGRVSGFMGVRGPRDEVPETEALSGLCELTLQPAADGGGTLALLLTLSDFDFTFRVTTGWSSLPATGTSVAGVDWIEAFERRLLEDAGPDPAAREEARRRAAVLEKRHPEYRQVQIGRADFRQEAAVLGAGDFHHDEAVRALTNLEVLLDEPGYRQRGELRLFAAPRVEQAPQRVRPTRDWVLFHRRRRSSCDCECSSATLPQVERSYRVYHLPVSPDATVDQIRATITGIRSVEGLRPVGVIPAFQGDTSTLLTPRHDVADAWRAASPGESIAYGAVAAAEPARAEPTPTQSARLERVAAIVDDVTPDPGGVYEVLDQVPVRLDAQGVDGVMVFATRVAVEAVCQRVFSFTDQGMTSFFLQRLARGELAAALSDLPELGQVRFTRGTANPTGGLDAVAAAWRERWPDFPVNRAVVVLPDDGRAEEARPQQADRVVRASGGEGVTEPVQRSGEDVFGSCGSLLVLEPGQRELQVTCQRVVRLTEPQNRAFRRFLDSGDTAAAVRFLDAAPTATVLDFVQGTDQPRFTQQDVTSFWEQHGGGRVVAGATVIGLGSPEADATQQQRTGVVVGFLSGSGGDLDTVRLQMPLALCGAATVLVAETRQTTRTGRLVAVRVANSGARSVVDAPPEIRVAFAADGTMQGGLPSMVVEWLRRHGPNGYVRLHFATAETDPDATARDARMAAVDAAVRGADVFVASAPAATQLAADEQPLLDANGTRVDDVVFMQPQ